MKQQIFQSCPRPDCDGQMVYTITEAACAKGHQFDHYTRGALREIVGPDFKRASFLYIDGAEFMVLADRGARLWNALVNFSNDYFGKFQGKLLDLAIDLRDEAKGDGRHDKTQMDFEVERMVAAGWRSYEGKR